MGRKPCCSREGLNRGAWTAMEDKILSEYIKIHGEGKWRKLPNRAGLKRCGKSCRLRWFNYLKPDIKRGNITHEEEDLIIRLHNLLGNRWSLIAGRLPGRTDNEIKNYWNTKIAKKLRAHENKSYYEPNPAEEPPNADTNACVIRTKAKRCTKVIIDDDGQVLNGNKPMMMRQGADQTEGPPQLSGFLPKEKRDQSDLMLDFGMDENFLSDLLNTINEGDTFSQYWQAENRGNSNRSNYSNIPSEHDQGHCSRNCDESLFFCDDMLRDSDLPLPSTAVLIEAEPHCWFQDKQANPDE